MLLYINKPLQLDGLKQESRVSQLPRAWPSAGSYGTLGMFGVRVQSTVSLFLLNQTLGDKSRFSFRPCSVAI